MMRWMCLVMMFVHIASYYFRVAPRQRVETTCRCAPSGSEWSPQTQLSACVKHPRPLTSGCLWVRLGAWHTAGKKSCFVGSLLTTSPSDFKSGSRSVMPRGRNQSMIHVYFNCSCEQACVASCLLYTSPSPRD